MGILGIYGTTKAGLPVSQSAGLYVSGASGPMKVGGDVSGKSSSPWDIRLLRASCLGPKGF